MRDFPYMDRLPDTVKPRALQAMGINHLTKVPSMARKLAREAMRWAFACNDLYTVVTCYALIGVAFSLDGDYQESLNVLREGFPLVRYSLPQFPVLYFNYLNPVAIGLSAMKRLPEARRVISLSVAIPFARFYPEWSHTQREINYLDGQPSSGLIYLPAAPPKRTSLKLVDKGTDAMQAASQPNAEEVAVQIMGEIENAVWRILPDAQNGDKLKVLNYLRTLEARAKIGSISA